jgi:hypothetical protein
VLHCFIINPYEIVENLIILSILIRVFAGLLYVILVGFAEIMREKNEPDKEGDARGTF